MSSTQPEAELPVGRLPKPPHKFLGPLKHLTANYQLYAAQQYHEEGQGLVKGLGEEHPEWKEKPQFRMLVTNGNMYVDFRVSSRRFAERSLRSYHSRVASYLEDAFDQRKWDREKNRIIKHEARKYRTSAYVRSSPGLFGLWSLISRSAAVIEDRRTGVRQRYGAQNVRDR